MALVIETEYANSNAADTNYPQGSFKNRSGPGLYDGTPLEKAWPNDIYGLLQKLLDVVGITPSGVPDTVLASDYYDALVMLFAKPVGEISLWPFSTIPSGFIEPVGVELLRSSYQDLYDYALASGDMITEAAWQVEYAAGGCGKFSSGDGSTTFRTPDLRAEFIRILDGGRGIDTARVLGSWAEDLFKAHTHTTGSAFSGSGTQGGYTGAAGVTFVTGSTGGAETRPRSVALKAIMRYRGY